VEERAGSNVAEGVLMADEKVLPVEAPVVAEGVTPLEGIALAEGVLPAEGVPVD
jgi:hypothetical protein